VSEEILAISNERFANAIYQYEVTPPDSTITEEELRILGLNPVEVFRTVPIYPTDRNNEVVDNDDFYLDDSDLEIVEHDIHFGDNGDIFPMIVQYSRDLGDLDDLSLTSGDDDDDTEEEVEEFEDEESSSSLSGEDFDEHHNSISTDSSSRLYSPSYVREQTPQPIMDSDHSDQSVNNSWDLNDDSSIGSLPDAVSSLESIPNDSSSYSEDSTSSSGSNINYLNDTNSSGSTTSSPSSTSSSSN